MTVDDALPAERVTAVGFHELDTRMFRRSWPDPQLRPPDRGANWVDRTRHLVTTDPGGCWVAEDESRMLGVVVSFVREKMWLLASYAVVPGAQGMGLGKALLAPALEYGRGSLRGMFNASSDPKALRRYHAAGFTLHPQMFLRGPVDRSQLPAVAGVRDGRPDDVELMDGIARDLRGGGHGTDHAALAETARPLVAETATGRGFAYTDGSRLALLAATDEATARNLLWACLADGGSEYLVPHVSGANLWAVDIGLTAGLALQQSGYLGVRGLAPPAPYVHNGALL